VLGIEPPPRPRDDALAAHTGPAARLSANHGDAPRAGRCGGVLLCLASGVAYGAMAMFGKFAYDEGATVGTLLAVRFSLAAALLWALVLAAGGARGPKRRDVGTGLALGAVGYALQAAFFFAALQRIDASLLSLIVYTFPAMVAVAAVALGRERLTRARLTALVLALAGLVLVVAGAGAGSLDPLGAALGLGAAVVCAAYILVSDRVVGRVPPLALAALLCTGAAVPLTGGSALLGELRPAELTAAGWGSLVCLAAVSTVGAIGLFLAGLRRAGPTNASILATAEPLVTVLLAFIVFGETLSSAQLIGGALVLAAAIRVSIEPRRTRWTSRWKERSRSSAGRPAEAGAASRYPRPRARTALVRRHRRDPSRDGTTLGKRGPVWNLSRQSDSDYASGVPTISTTSRGITPMKTTPDMSVGRKIPSGLGDIWHCRSGTGRSRGLDIGPSMRRPPTTSSAVRVYGNPPAGPSWSSATGW
jgi:drug/metabolite transporter (DMT)-like permease